ncbi:unnamed protein product [Oppiella nova]|uniref:MD-2-related lipid-recognition domain-containing protein n=1 Tax=Oppiella nova TaxID=334625 RepID=A0A7R9MNE4_9ACAR|nr:unnamed protein product [Oppiella nova]CAG2179460.1 unnamed protein product [Oppiella nova]
MNNLLTSSVCVILFTFVMINNCYAGFTYTICDESQLKGIVNWINVSDCDPSLTDRCIFKKGTNVTISTSESTDSLKVKITGTVLGLSVPWRVNPDNACAHGVNCPVAANVDNVFMLSMPISPAYPSIPVQVRLRLEDSRKRPHFCAQFPVKIDN